MSRVMRKPAFLHMRNKGADQLLCFRYIDSTIALLPKSKIFKPLVISCSCTAWFVSDTPKTGFLTTRLCQAVQSQKMARSLKITITIRVAKTKTLICAFVSHMQKSRFSHDESHIMSIGVPLLKCYIYLNLFALLENLLMLVTSKVVIN